MLRQKSETQHQIPGISNLPFCYFHLYTHGLTYTKGGSRTLLAAAKATNHNNNTACYNLSPVTYWTQYILRRKIRIRNDEQPCLALEE